MNNSHILIHNRMVVFGSLIVLGFLAGMFPNSCAAQGDLIWQPEFETNGIESDTANSVKDWKRWGFIDKSGTFVIEPKYDLVKSFSDGISTVGVGERFFDIDKTGKVISGDMTRVQVSNRSNKKRWAIEAQEKEEEEKGKYRGDIFDSTGTKRLGAAAEFKIRKFSEGLAACSEGPREEANYPNKNLNRTGYIDERGWMVIAPIFESGEEFHNGIAKVNRSGFGRLKYGSGYINRKGQLLGGHFYSYAWDFSNGLAIIGKEGKTSENDEWGFLDKAGKELWGHWTEVAEYSGKIVGVRDKAGLWGFVDKEGKAVIPNQFSQVHYKFAEQLTYVKTDSGYGFIDENGQTVIKPSFIDVENFSDGLAPAAVTIPDREKMTVLNKLQKWRCGFIDPSGKKIAGGFFAAHHFSEGLAAVSTGLKWGFIDSRGVMVIPAKFDQARSFAQGLAAVQVGDRWGYIDKAGTFKIQPKFLSRNSDRYKIHPQNFSEGLVLAASPDYFWRFYDMKGNEAFRLPLPISLVGEPDAKEFSNGLAAFPSSTGFKFGYIDPKGNFQIPPKLESATSFSENLAAVGVDNPKLPIKDVEHYIAPSEKIMQPTRKFGFINTTGTFVIQPKFDEVGAFHEGIATVACGEYGYKNEGHPGSVRFSQKPPGPELLAKWGYVDKLAKQIVSMKFESAKRFSENLAPVQMGTKWGFINRTGKFSIGPRFESASPFSNGLASIALHGKYGFINHQGAVVIKPTYSMAGSFSNNRALVVSTIDSGTQISTKDRMYSKPLDSGDDIMEFLIQSGSPPDQNEWAGGRH